MKKKILSIMLTVVMGAVFISGCSENDDNDIVVGISQYAEHSSLDNCREGFIEGLKQGGYEEGKNITIKYLNSQADMSVSAQIATDLVSNSDIICAIATPSAQTCFNAAEPKNVPVIYSAVNSPETANLVDENGKNVGEVTGTSDKLPVEKQLETIRKFLPDAKNIGIMYTTNEANSLFTIEEYKKAAPEYGFEIVEAGVNNVSEIPMALDGIIGKIDCMANLTDNNVVNSLPVILEKTNAKKIPVFGSEVEQVVNGCAAGVGIDYNVLGIETGRIAARVLDGEKASEIPYEIIDESFLYINSDILASLGLTCPSELRELAIEVEK